MEHQESVYRATAWQASLPIFLHNLADKWEEAANSSISHYQPQTKKLTTEAICVLCVYMFVVILCVLGSSINAYESFRKAFLKKKNPKNLKDQKKEGNRKVQVGTKKKEDESSILSDRKGNFRKFLDCFCLQTNARKILSINSNPEAMDCIDGIRAILFLWIFIAHYLMFLSRSVKNLDKKLHLFHELPISELTGHAAFGIDIFTLVSGFLTMYSFSKYYEKNNGKIPWLSFYCIRILRVTPVYMAVLGFYSTLFTYVGSSPVWPTYNTNPVCRERWIWNLLYINNLIPHHTQCMSMTYFLACIMQLYIISPLFMVPLNRWPKFGYALSIVTICCSCYASFVTSKKYNLFGILPKCTDLEELYGRIWQFIDVYHQKTYVKLTAYVIGLLLGYYLHRRKLSKRSSLLTLFLGWAIFFITMWICLFSLHNKEETALASAVYNGVKGFLFSCGSAWLIFVLATKQAGLISKLISHPIWKPISRLSFCGFLIETIVFEGFFLSVDVFENEFDMSKGLMHNLEWIPILGRLTLWTLGSSFVASLLFEYPVIRLIHTYFTEKKKTL